MVLWSPAATAPTVFFTAYYALRHLANLQTGKRDFFENTPIGLRPFKDDISYFGIDADQLLTARPQLAARLFCEVMALFREGTLTP